MTKNKKIILFAICIVIVIATITATTLALNNKAKHTETSESGEPTIPQTTEEQNKEGDEAFNAALTAMNDGKGDEAKKQLDLALRLYKAAGNEDGINSVNSQYPIVETIPKQPVSPPTEATKGK